MPHVCVCWCSYLLFFFLFADSFAKVIWLKCFHTRNCNKLSDKLQREKNSISSETFYELFFVFSSFSMWISIIARMCDVNDEVVHMKAIIASCWLFIYLPFQLVITTFMLSTRGMNKFKAVLFWSLCFFNCGFGLWRENFQSDELSTGE